ncbi:hypothetical protein QYF36_026083 [Acer negundo]|nr:hypothetical protein QYF36_026083 [Acer negundo]
MIGVALFSDTLPYQVTRQCLKSRKLKAISFVPRNCNNLAHDLLLAKKAVCIGIVLSQIGYSKVESSEKKESSAASGHPKPKLKIMFRIKGSKADDQEHAVRVERGFNVTGSNPNPSCIRLQGFFKSDQALEPEVIKKRSRSCKCKRTGQGSAAVS